MFTVFTWYLALQFIALASWPLAFTVCHKLFDRGYGLSKGLGLVIVAFVTMILAHLGQKWPALGFSFQTVSASWFGLLLISLLCIARNGRSLAIFLRRRWRYIAMLELVMIVAFALMVGLRAAVPHISYHIPNPMPGALVDHAAEKFMDFAILNGLLTSSAFPPQDPWVSGHTLNYYYFGHMMWAVLVKFSSTLPEVGFNLALASVFAISSALAFALGFNLSGRLRWGWMTLFLICLCSNLDGFWQFLTAIKTALLDSSSVIYFVDRAWWKNYDFWSSSRAIANTINEFPAFSFILGDLHAHLSALAINLCGWNLAVQMFRSVRQHRSIWRYEIHAIDELFLAALILGALGATNSWDVPIFIGVIALALWSGSTGQRNPYAYDPPANRATRRAGRAIGALFIAGLVAVVGIAILFAPFTSNFKVPAPAPIEKQVIVDGLTQTVVEPGSLVRKVQASNRSNPFEFVTHWFLLATIPVGFSVCLLTRRFRRQCTSHDTARTVAVAFVVGAAAVVLLTLWEGWVAVLTFSFAILVSIMMVAQHLPPMSRWIAGLTLMFFVMTWFCEMFYLDDIFDGPIERINTVFKVYYGLWPAMAVATVLSMRLFIRMTPRPHRRWVAAGLVAPLVIAGSPYMVLGVANRIDSTTRLGYWDRPADSPNSPPPSAIMHPDARAKNLDEALNGLRYLAYTHPDDYPALLWVRANLPPDSVILEAAGSQYTYAGRFATLTGRPTLAGWITHSWVWRGASFGDPLNPSNERQRRLDSVARIYEEPDPAVARQLLARENIEYVIVSDVEREIYPSINEAKFDQLGEKIYSSGNTTIYKVTPPQ